MIIFHEGLPRSGKSYEATKEHIVPALANGRRVYARINGLNYEKIAELAGITEERCRELLIHIEPEQVTEVYKFVQPDALIVLDELQNFFPNVRQKLTDHQMRFIAEHGHHGLDILILGQSFNDIHSAWRRRTERKIMFLKLTAVGKENSYQWTAYQAIPQNDRDPRWNKAASGIKKYDKAFFGAYASHSSGVENKGAYSDGRFVIWNRKSLRYGLPAAIVLAGLAVWWVAGFFSDPERAPVKTKTQQQQQQNISQPAPGQNASPTGQSVAPRPPAPKVPKSVQSDYFYLSMQKATANLTYVERLDNRILDILVEMRNSNDETVESWTMQDIISQGWTLKYRSFGIEAKKDGFVVLLREKPVVYLADSTPVVGIKNPMP